MNSRTPLTDSDIEAQRKEDAYLRKQTLDKAVIRILVCAMYIGSIILGLAFLYCVVIYCIYMIKSDFISQNTAQTLESMFKVVLGGATVHIAHLVKRNTVE